MRANPPMAEARPMRSPAGCVLAVVVAAAGWLAGMVWAAWQVLR